jgi:TLC domain
MQLILASFVFCGLVYIGFYLTNKDVAVSCELTSMTHHIIAAIIGLYATYVSWDFISSEASLGANHLYPWSTELQHFNIGYFLYDSIHVLIWDQKFILHHMVALLGFGVSEYTGVFALANAVNIFITEIGSMMYNWYNKHKTLNNYILFVTGYSISRFVFLVWSLSVFYQCAFYQGANTYVWWIPHVASALQLSLLYVNGTFLLTHIRKLRALLNKAN